MDIVRIEASEPLQSCSDDDDESDYSPTSKLRTSSCFRLHKFVSQNSILNYLLPGAVLIAILIVIYFCRGYAKSLLFWIETQNQWLIFSVFMLLFIVVSFPVTVGYLVLIITSGYLFGCLKGFLTVILGANIGVAVAHNTIRCVQNKLPVHRLIKNETGRAILRVISGPRAFKVVLFTRLTPVPFGIQNTIFGVSSVNSRSYHTATLLGLLPAQAINVYLGSTLRSMHDVLNDHKTAITGYTIFAIQVLIGVALMTWVVQKARHELSEALLTEMEIEQKLIVDI